MIRVKGQNLYRERELSGHTWSAWSWHHCRLVLTYFVQCHLILILSASSAIIIIYFAPHKDVGKTQYIAWQCTKPIQACHGSKAITVSYTSDTYTQGIRYSDNPGWGLLDLWLGIQYPDIIKHNERWNHLTRTADSYNFGPGHSNWILRTNQLSSSSYTRGQLSGHINWGTWSWSGWKLGCWFWNGRCN